VAEETVQVAHGISRRFEGKTGGEDAGKESDEDITEGRFGDAEAEPAKARTYRTQTKNLRRSEPSSHSAASVVGGRASS